MHVKHPFLCLKSFSKTSENILRIGNHFLEVQQSEYHNISMKFIFVENF